MANKTIMKLCPACNQNLPRNKSFGRNKSKEDGYHHICKKCNVKAASKSRASKTNDPKISNAELTSLKRAEILKVQKSSEMLEMLWSLIVSPDNKKIKPSDIRKMSDKEKLELVTKLDKYQEYFAKLAPHCSSKLAPKEREEEPISNKSFDMDELLGVGTPGYENDHLKNLPEWKEKDLKIR